MSKEQGQLAEQAALAYLKQQGLSFVEQNFYCRGGEIDLIMKDQNTLVFVEVRYRKSSRYGSAVESITRQKQQRIIHTANIYIQQHNPRVNGYRFDVISMSPDNPPYWIKNAFSVN